MAAAAANWFFITLLLSLCLARSYGNRAGLSAMLDDEAKESVNLSQDNNKNSDSEHEVDTDDSSSSDSRHVVINYNVADPIYGGPPLPDCSCGSGGVDIIGGGCGCGCSCPYIDRGYGTCISELTLTVKELTKKLEANALGQNNPMNMQAMAPGSW